MAANFPNLGREMDTQIQRPREPQTGWTFRATLRHLVVKMSKTKDRILKAATKKRSYKRAYWQISQQKLQKPE